MSSPPLSIPFRFRAAKASRGGARLQWREALPIVTRELRAASKRRLTYRLRMIVAILGATEILLASAFLPGFSVEFGTTLFFITSVFAMILCGGAGFILTADSISREKREDTLGLLFLTRLSSVDIVLGKWAVGALNGGSVAFAALPFLAFSLAMGGVNASQFWLMSLFLLFLLSYSLTLGIFFSALFRREAIVSICHLVAIFLPVAILPMVLWKLGTVPVEFARWNPFYPALAVMDYWGVTFPHENVRSTLIFQSFLIVLMLAISCLVLPLTVAARPRSTKRISPRVVRKMKTVNRRAILEINPILWLNESSNHPLVLLGIFAGARFVVGRFTSIPFEADVAYAIALALLPKAILLWQSSGMMAAERRSGFLEALLTTPMSAREILSGKMRALKRNIFPAVLFALLAQWTISTKWWSLAGEIPISSTLLFAGMGSVLVDIQTIGWIGLWRGLVARDRRRALIGSIFFGVIGPWLPSFLFFGMITFLFDPKWTSIPVLTLGPALIVANIISVGIAAVAMARLHEKFRSTATASWSQRSLAA